MNAPRLWKIVPTLLVACAVGAAYAKLPPPTEEAKAKAAAAKAKADEGAKKQAELLGKAQDRVVERYKKEKGMMPAAMKTAAPAKMEGGKAGAAMMPAEKTKKK